MTVSTVISREEYTGNGVTTDFDYRFRVFSADGLVVTVVDTTENISTLKLNTDYTVTGAGGRNGGKVKLTKPLALDWRINIERELPVTQETDVRNQGNFFPEVHEDAWDKLTMLIQQALGYFGLALRKPGWLAKYYDARNNRIANLSDAKNPQDAVNLRSMYAYVDKMIAGVVGGFGWFIQAGSGAIHRTFQDKMRDRLTVIDFGADPSGVRESTLAFQQSIAAAIANGYKTVKVPSGTYLFKGGANGELNTGGFEYYGNAGILIDGEGIDNTKFIFDAQNADDVLISVRGGSGTNTARGIKNLTIISKNGTAENPNKKGIGLLVEGGCFVYCDNVNIRFLNVGVKLHNNLAGQFTEFCHFRNMRIDRNNINTYCLTTNGNNSFHGLQFSGIQSQILDWGYGFRAVSNNGGRLHIYNSDLGINFFGSTSGAKSYAISMTMCTCDNSYANMTFEGDVYLQSTDDSWFHCWGIFGGYNGTLRFDCPVAPRLGVPANFIFNNVSSAGALGNFSESYMNLWYPQIFDLNYSNRALSGSYPGIIRTRSSDATANSLAIVNGENDVSGFRFGSIPDGGRLQDFKTKWVLNTLGTVLASYNPAGTLYLNANNTSSGMNGRVFLSPSTFSPGSDNTMSCGNSGQKWSQVYATNGTINTSDADHKTDPRNPNDTEIEAFYEIGAELPWVWQWLAKYELEGDEARQHSGPTVQAAIGIMGKHGLNWTDYSCFCYDSWQEQEEIIRYWDAQPAVYETVPAREAVVNDAGDVIEPGIPERQVVVMEAIDAGSEITQEYRSAGGEYSFRKDELLLWIVRATITKQKAIEERVSKLESLPV